MSIHIVTGKMEYIEERHWLDHLSHPFGPARVIDAICFSLMDTFPSIRIL